LQKYSLKPSGKKFNSRAAALGLGDECGPAVLWDLPQKLDRPLVQIDALAPQESVRICKETNHLQPLVHSNTTGEKEHVIIRCKDGKYETVQHKPSFKLRN